MLKNRRKNAVEEGAMAFPSSSDNPAHTSLVLSSLICKTMIISTSGVVRLKWHKPSNGISVQVVLQE